MLDHTGNTSAASVPLALADALDAGRVASGDLVLFVGFGVPLQEAWIAEHRAVLNAPVALGVGGLFDYYSGSIPRAPLWMREIGLEWVWRLLQEPGRMWKRYIIGNPLYLYAGAATDNNAFLFFEGAWNILQPRIADGTFYIVNSSEAIALQDQAELTRDQYAQIIGQITTNWDFNTAKNLAEANLTIAGAEDKGDVFILAPNDGTARQLAEECLEVEQLRQPAAALLDQARRKLTLIVFVDCDQRGLDSEMLQQFPAVTGIFGGDTLDRAQHLDRTRTQVTQVADRRRHNIQAAFHVFPLYYAFSPDRRQSIA